MKTFIRFILCCVVFIFSTINVNANSNTSKRNTTVSEVIVTTRIHQSQAETALPVTVLNGDELRQHVANTIGETLSGKPGLANASFGPSVGQPVIRGQQGARVTTLLNSTSSSDASNISPDHAVSTEPLLAESVEVLRGPSTLLYGGGAIGGVVNVIDKRIPTTAPEKTSTTIEYRHGSVNDENTAVLSHDGGKGSFAYHLDALNRETNNVEISGSAINTAVIAVTPEQNSRGTLQNTNSDTKSYTAGGSYFFEQDFVGMAVNRLDNVYGIPPGEEGETVRLDIDQTRYDVRGVFNVKDSAINSVHAFFTYSDYEHDELEIEEAETEVGTQWSNRSWESRLELLHSINDAWQGIVGLQIKRSKLTAIGEESFIPRTRTQDYGLFILESFHQKDWTFELGARFDHDNIEADASEALLTSTKESFNSVSLSASALWQFDPSWNLGLALSHSERAPVIEELYSNRDNNPGSYVVHVATASIEVGDATLDTENAQNIDLTLSYKNDTVEGYITAYYNDFQDYIFLLDTGAQQSDIPIFQYTQTDARFKGIELEISTMLGNAFGGEFSFDIFGDSIDGKLDGAGDAPRLPPLSYGGRLNYNSSELSVYTSVRHAKKQDKPGLNQAKTASYTRVDAGLDYQIDSKSWGEYLLFLHAKNIGNKTIRNSTSFLRDIAPEAGRSVEIGLRMAF